MSTVDPSRAARIKAQVEQRRALLAETTEFLHAHPELAYEETASSRHLVEKLRAVTSVETGFPGLPTAFRATLVGSQPGPTVALLAVYDAVAVTGSDGGIVPEHSCGHGPISAAAVGAVLALADLDDLAGRVVVIGAPADELVSPAAIERGGGKVVGLTSGLWQGVDLALYAHPESHTGVWRDSRWMRLVRVTGASGPTSRLAELIPGAYGFGPARRDRRGRESYVLRVLGADEAEIEHREKTARDALQPAQWEWLSTVEGLLADPTAAATAEQTLSVLGEPLDTAIPPMPFSTDFGNISRLIPAAMIGLSHPDGWRVHEPRGLEQFRSADGIDLAVRAAAVLAITADALGRAAAKATT